MASAQMLISMENAIALWHGVVDWLWCGVISTSLYLTASVFLRLATVAGVADMGTSVSSREMMSPVQHETSSISFSSWLTSATTTGSSRQFQRVQHNSPQIASHRKMYRGWLWSASLLLR
ncbi:hypothetical protein ARMGADRAFT_775362 [Armillaria gallica]|uniref:Uncharacterized protein n=1 Tax=Armillaria gallica TaxID=47427 RepID=A0A2H3CY00_ARMGA|nr:hypothetical protein ARMGADRAFT_775362 [Armillaria gallica]